MGRTGLLLAACLAALTLAYWAWGVDRPAIDPGATSAADRTQQPGDADPAETEVVIPRSRTPAESAPDNAPSLSPKAAEAPPVPLERRVFSNERERHILIGQLEGESKAAMRELHRYTADAYRAAWHRGDYRVAKATNEIELEGRLVSVEFQLDGEIRYVELPREGNEHAYTIKDDIDRLREQVRELRDSSMGAR